MKIKSLMITAALAFCALPLFAYASNIYVTNNTKLPGTAKIGDSDCSSEILGESGIIKPGAQDYIISEYAIGYYCWWSSCDAHVFASNNCSGPEVFTIRVSASDGVVNVTNHDPKHYRIDPNGNHLTFVSIEASSVGKRFSDWMKSLF